MTDTKGQPMTRPAGWGRGGATAGDFRCLGELVVSVRGQCNRSGHRTV